MSIECDMFVYKNQKGYIKSMKGTVKQIFNNKILLEVIMLRNKYEVLLDVSKAINMFENRKIYNGDEIYFRGNCIGDTTVESIFGVKRSMPLVVAEVFSLYNNISDYHVNKKLKIKKNKNKWISLILLLTLGFFGAHKFYEEKYGLGILYLLTMGFMGIGIFIDFIIILTKN